MSGRTDDDFLGFYRRYARTGIHAAATALLTLFGLLASVADQPAFVGVGIAIYVLPLAYLYLAGDRSSVAPTGSESTDDAVTESADDANSAAGGTRATDFEPDEVAPGSQESDSEWRWRPTTAPTDADLVDATAAADGLYVVGVGGELVARRPTADDWDAVIERGASGDGTAFTAVDATSDGGAVWAVGDGGAVTRYDVDVGRHIDHSAPDDLTSSWTAVAVAGSAGSETVTLANGSGILLRGVVADDGVTWGVETKPGSGSSIADLDFATPTRGLVCDTAGDVFETTDGDAFARVGLDGPDGTLTALSVAPADRGGADHDRFESDSRSSESDASPRTTVVDDAGTLYRRTGGGWSRERPGSVPLFDVTTGGGGVAVGADGTVLEATTDGWETVPTPVDATLRGVACDDDGSALAVGDDGTVLERRNGASDVR